MRVRFERGAPSRGELVMHIPPDTRAVPEATAMTQTSHEVRIGLPARCERRALDGTFAVGGRSDGGVHHPQKEPPGFDARTEFRVSSQSWIRSLGGARTGGVVRTREAPQRRGLSVTAV
jgi:hypothetical protein